MVEARVVDTNVLIVASAADEGSPFRPEATPIEEAALRQEVLVWFSEFEQDPQRHAVLDYDWLICKEYQQKLTNQDYGWLALMAKNDRNEVVWVEFSKDADDHAILSPELTAAVTDRADRKMVAAVIASREHVLSCRLTNACDTDWLDCADALSDNDIEVEHLVEDWLRTKWYTMHNKA